jgi:hypothetical protein
MRNPLILASICTSALLAGLAAYAVADLVQGGAGAAFPPYVHLGLSRGDLLAAFVNSLVGIFAAILMTRPEWRLGLAFGRISLAGAVAVAAIVALATVFRSGMDLDPYPLHLSQGYSMALFPRLFDVGHLHPLFSEASSKSLMLYYNIFPVDYYLSTKVMAIHIAGGFLLAMTLCTVFFTRCGLAPAEAVVAAITLLLLVPKAIPYALEGTNPWVLNLVFAPRVFLAGAVAAVAIALTANRWLWSGLALGVLGLLHLKFGLRAIAYVGMTAAVLHAIPATRPRMGRFGHMVLMLILGATIACLPMLLLNSSIEPILAALRAPEAEPLVHMLGWLIKNEPDDWFVSFRDPAAFVPQFLATAAAGALASGLLAIKGSDSRLRLLGWALFVANGLAVVALGWSHLFEHLLIDLPPHRLVILLLLVRPWGGEWIPVAAVSLPGIILATGALRTLRWWPRILAVAIVAAVVSPTASALLEGRLFAPDGTIGPAQSYAYAEVCSPEADRFLAARNAVIDNIRRLDLVAARAAASELEHAAGALAPGVIDPLPHAANAHALVDMAEGHYGTAYSRMLGAQRRLAAGWKGAPELAGQWMGDMVLRCDPPTVPAVRWRSLEIPMAAYRDATRWIKRNVPERDGVIAPPYLPGFTSLSQRAGFWDGKIDNHMMYHRPAYYKKGYRRLDLVAGADALMTAPGFRFGDVGPEGRQHFLSMTVEQLALLRTEFPGYTTLLTERGHALPLPILYENETFIVYHLPGP